jgi:zinc transport system ATP-binding protein
MSGEYAGHIENLSVHYGHTPALMGVCLNVSDGEYLGIIGPNGGGKSTLLKAILGLVPVSSGNISIYMGAMRIKTGPLLDMSLSSLY